ncbi:prepilin-type N-terminal cleavage/methylation domain-containing protein [Planctomicrobium sp. SH527]|uniref:prepilin-type N-terminal cleavage/methylation domain-containing protein n=1 Tax=Planctomicrobium sp. SH527 TaxID=3448123 RepID=UPI003F5C4D38
MRQSCSCRRSNARNAQQARPAFTMLELLLVVSVLGIIAALSWPRLFNNLKLQTLQGNVEQVRQVLDRARVRAVEEGVTLQVRYEPQGRKYVILPQESLDTNSSSGSNQTAGTTTSIRTTTRMKEPYRVYELGSECHFHVDNALLSGQQTIIEKLDDSWLTQLQNGELARDVGWSTPILYFPDGSATDGSVVVMNQSRRYAKLHVRGLTGAVSVQPIAEMSEKLGATGN